MEIKTIGIIHSPFNQAGGTPIQPVFSKTAQGVVEVFEQYADGLKDVDGFERVWLIYWLDRAKDFRLRVKPYMDTNERGLFATRAPSRPNAIGMSSVRLERVEGNRLYIRELDILDGTPLLDIKPYASRFDCFATKRDGWLSDVDTDRHIADDRFHK